MTVEIGWKRLLEDNFHKFEPDTSLGLDDCLAIDVNGNGTIEPDEIIDDFTSDSTHTAYFVDEDEAKRFCIRHGRELASKIPFLRSVISHGFKSDNPINEYVLYESQLFRDYYQDVDAAVEKVYSDLEEIERMVEGQVTAWALQPHAEEPVTPQDLAFWAHAAIEAQGIEFENGGPILFIENFITEDRTFDCDISTLTFIAVMHEIGRDNGWRYGVVPFPEHMFARATNEATGEHVNIEVRGPAAEDDDFYIRYRENGRRRLEENSIEQGVYLAVLDDAQLKSEFFLTFATALAYMSDEQFPNRLELAEELLDEAIDLYPMNEAALSNRCMVRLKMGRFNQALSDCNAAHWYDPNDANVYGALGDLKLRMAEAAVDNGSPQADERPLYVDAIELLNEAIRLNDEKAIFYTNLCYAEIVLGEIDGDWDLIGKAKRSCSRALELDPQNAAAQANIEAIETSLENL